MTLFHAPSVQSPAGYSAQNLQGAQLAARMQTAASAAVRASLAAAIQDSGYRYKIHPKETAAGLVDANLTFGYDPGDLRRYGVDLTGVASAVIPITRAIAANNQVFFPDGSYLIDSTITINPGATLQGLVLKGSDKQRAVLHMTAAAGANATILNFAVQLYLGLRIESLGFFIDTATAGQTCLQFSELRGGSIVADCQFGSIGTGASVATGVQFNGTGNYTAETVVEKCNFFNLKNPILLQGSITDISIDHNILTQGAAIAGSVGITVANTVGCPRLTRNQIQGFTVGINAAGTYMFQYRNFFENNTQDWVWARGAGNAFIAGVSMFDSNPAAGLTVVYPVNNVDSCVVLFDGREGNSTFDNQFVVSGLGFRERLRTFNLGDYQTPAFLAGNFGASGATWTVAAGNVSTYSYSIYGKTLTVNWFVSGSTVAGAPVSLQISIPGGFISTTRLWAACKVTKNGVNANGLAEVTAGGNNINIYVDDTTTTAWPGGAGNSGTSGSMTFQVN